MKTLNRILALFLACILPSVTLANPVGGTVVGGSATIAGQGTPLTTINQQTHNAIINWQGFSIGAGEITHFNQPSATATIMNRVVSGNPTEIYGMLQGNGRVFVINANGILVGRGGVVDTKGFLASTRDIPNANFMSGGSLSLSGDSTAAVRNDGSIHALGGDVFLVAHTVENSGTISARQGTVGLAAGSQINLVQSGHEHISVLAGSGSADTGINNQGTIEAASAELKAAGGNIYSLAINNGGVVRATSIANEGGRIVLRASGGSIRNTGSLIANKASGSGGEIIMDGGHNAATPSTVTSTGTIQARGDAAGTRGGKIQVTGDHVGVFDDAVFDVSGDRGGGTVLLGGDYRGANPNVQNSEATFVSPNAQIRADALTSGNGGKVVVWSDAATRFYGSISAQGGSHGGNGGSVETSGHYLDFQGHVSTAAPRGAVGNLLLDPTDLTIDNTADQNVTGTTTFSPTASPSHLTWASISSALALNDVTVTTVGSPTSGSEAGDITVAAGTTTHLNSSHNLTLGAAGLIKINAGSAIFNDGSGGLEMDAANGITINDNITLTGGGALVVHSGTDGSGNIAFAGSVTINANSQTYQAGNTAGGASGASVNFHPGGTDPVFNRGNTSAGLDSFTYRQDHSIASTDLPSSTEFTATLPSAYTIRSDGGSVALPTMTAPGSLNVVAAGAITDAGDLTVAGLASFKTLNNAGSAITLNANDSFGSVSAQVRNAADSANASATITIHETDVSGTVLAGESTGGDLVVQSAGPITQTGALTVGGAASFKTLNNSGAAITLDRAGDTVNNGFGSVDARVRNASDSANANAKITIHENDGDGTVLATESTTGDLEVVSTGPITQSGALTVGGLASFKTLNNSGAAITLDRAADSVNNSFGSVDARIRNSADSANANATITIHENSALGTVLAGIQTGGNLNLVSSGPVTQTGDLNVAGAAAFKTLTAGTGTIDLDRAGDTVNNSFGSVSASTHNAGDTGTVAADITIHENDGGTVLAGVGTAGNLTVVSDGDITETGALLVTALSKTASFTTASGKNVMLGSQNNNFGGTIVVAASSGSLNDVAIKNITATSPTAIGAGDQLDFPLTGLHNLTLDYPNAVLGLTLPAISVLNNLTVSAGIGPIAQSGTLSAGGLASFNSGGAAALGNITLNDSANQFGSLGLTSASGSAVSVTEGGAMVLDNIAVTVGTLNLTSGGLISQVPSTTVVVGGATTLNAGAGNDILLGNNNNFASVIITSGNNVTLNDINAIILGNLTVNGNLGVTAAGLVNFNGAGASTVGGTLNIGTTAGGIIDAGPGTLKVTGATTLAAGSGNDIILDNNNDFSSVAVNSAHNVTLNDINGINLGNITANGNVIVNAAGLVDIIGSGASTIGGTLAITTTTGGINDSGSGTLAVTGTTTLDAGAGNNITLDNNNNFSTVVITSGNNVTLKDSGAINLGNLAVSGNLDVTAGGLVDFTGAGLSTVAGTLAINTTSGGINDSGSGALAVTGTSTFTAGAANNITLDNNNNFSTVVVNSANNVTLKDSGAINLGNLTINGTLGVTAGGLVDFVGSGVSSVGGTMNISTTAGGIDDSGTGFLTVGGASTLTAGVANDITLNNNNDFNSVSIVSGKNVTLMDQNAIVLGASTVFGVLNVTAGGNITENGPLSVTAGNSFFTINGVTADVLVGSQPNHFAGQTITIGSIGGGIVHDVSVRNVDATALASSLVLPASMHDLSIQFDAAGINLPTLTLSGSLSVIAAGLVDFTGAGASTIAGSMNIVTTTGGINDSGSGTLAVAGTSTLTAGAGNDITLNNNNDFNTVVISSGKNVTLNDVNGLNLGNLTVNGNLAINAAGLVDFVGAGASTVGGTLGISTFIGGIRDSGSGSLAVAGTATLSAGFGNDITLDNNNNFSTVIITSGGNVTLNDLNAINLGDLAVSGNLGVTAGGLVDFVGSGASGVGGSMGIISTAGAISQSGLGTLFVGGNSTLSAGAGNDITLNNNNDFNIVTIAGAHNVTLRDVNAINLGNLTVSGNFNLTAGGLVDFVGSGVSTISGTLAVTTTAGGINDSGSGSLAVVGLTTLDAGTGNNITLDNNNDFSTVAIASGNNVTLRDQNAIDLGGSIVSGGLTVIARGTITESGALNVTGGSSTFLIDTVTADVLLGNQANHFAGQTVAIGSINGGTVNDVTFRNVDATAVAPILPASLNNLTIVFDAAPVALPGVVLNGNLNVTANGLISDNGNVIVAGTTTLTAGTANDIVLDNADDFGGAVNIVSANNVTLNDINALTLGGAVSGNLNATANGALAFNATTVANNLNATASGLISDNGDVTVGGTAALSAGFGNDIVLNNADDFGGAVTIGSAGNVTLNDVNNLTVGGIMSGNLTTTVVGATTFNSLFVGGNLTASGNGLISQNLFTTISVGGTTTLTAGSGNDITLANANDFGGAVTIVSGNNVALTDVNSLTESGTVSGNLTTTAGGALTIGGTVAGNVGANAAGSTTFNTLSVGGNLSAIGNGAITDNGNLTVAGTTTLGAGLANNIVLDNADDFGGAVTVLSANNVTLNDVNALNLGTLTANGNFNATAGGLVDFVGSGASFIGGGLTVSTPTGGINDSGSGSLTVGGGTALDVGAGNNITLNNNNDFSTVTVVSGNNVTLNDVNALTEAGTVSGNLTATAGGALAIGGTVAGNAGATAGGATTFNSLSVGGNLNATGNGPITETGNLTVAGTTALAAGLANDITLANANDFVGAVTVASGRNVTLNDVNALTVAATASGNLTTTAAGALTVGGSAGGDLNTSAGAATTLNAITVGGDANVTSVGDIADNGNVNVSGDSTFATAGGRDIILDSAGNTFGGFVHFVSTGGGNLNNVTINDTDAAFDIATITVDSTLDVRSGGNVSQSGNISANVANFSSTGGSVILGMVPSLTGSSAFIRPTYGFNNTANTVSATLTSPGQSFIFNGHNANSSADLNVGAVSTQNGTIAIQTDHINVTGPVNAHGGNVWLQPVSDENVDVGGSNPLGLGAPFVVDSAELHQIHADTLVIGHSTVPVLRQDSGLVIHNAPGNNFDNINGPIDANIIILKSVHNFVTDLSGALAGLSQINIPLPKLEAFNFSGANLTAEEARKLLPEGSIGELFLQLRMPVVEEAKYKVEESSKWTAGRVAASGTTAGPQTPR